MRRHLLAFAAAAALVLTVSDSAQSQKAVPVPPEPQCVAIDAVRQRMAAEGGQELAFLEGERARPLLDATHAPPRAVAVAIFGAEDVPAVIVVLLDAEGCAFAAGRLPSAAIRPFIRSV